MAIDDFFRARLDQMIDLRHPLAVLAVLAGRLPWSQTEAALAPAFERTNRPGQVVEIDDLFGSTQVDCWSGCQCRWPSASTDAADGSLCCTSSTRSILVMRNLLLAGPRT